MRTRSATVFKKGGTNEVFSNCHPTPNFGNAVGNWCHQEKRTLNNSRLGENVFGLRRLRRDWGLREERRSLAALFWTKAMMRFQSGLISPSFALGAFLLVLKGGAVYAATSILPQSAPSASILVHPWPGSFQASPFQPMNSGPLNGGQAHGIDPSPFTDPGFVPLLDAVEIQDVK
jgi:hypothetical protein